MAKILIIEDSRQTREILHDTLEAADYEVLEAKDGLEGVRLFRENRPDLIITDIFMPQKEGLETIQDIRADSPDLPIITISSGGIMDGKIALDVSRKLGATMTFEKPFDLEKLLDAIETLLAG